MSLEKEYVFQNKGALLLFGQNYGERLLRRQLAGERLLLLCDQDLENLAVGISTDGILPTKGGSCQTEIELAPFALSGISGIEEGNILSGNFGLLITGPGFGKGSSREHASMALRGAGIETVVVVGGRAERIFKENCLYAGGPLVVEIEGVDEANSILVQVGKGSLRFAEPYPDEIRPAIRDAGGLFAFTKKRLRGEVPLSLISHPELCVNHSMTVVEKILARRMVNVDPDHRVVLPGDVGFVEADLRFSHDFFTRMLFESLKTHFDDDVETLLGNKDSIILFEDHLVFAPERFRPLLEAQREIARRHGLKLYQQEEGLSGSLGICHTLVTQEALLLPGQVGFGSDSHTCTAGALNVLAFGGGTTAVANSFLTKDILIEVPETIKVVIEGRLPHESTAKDVILSVLSHPYIREGRAIGKVFEFVGEGLNPWPLDQQLVLTNMVVEGGALTGIIAQPTEALISHFGRKRRLSREEVMSMFIQSDPEAQFVEIIQTNLDEIEPMVAFPHHPTNVRRITPSEEIEINRAFIGSCTGGNLTDLRLAAKVLKQEGIRKGVELVVQPASMEIYRQAEQEGILDVFRRAGAQVLFPGCGACIGMGPGRVESPNDVVISATNRNFPGRMGERGEIYLASPLLVATSSIAGYICGPKDFK